MEQDKAVNHILRDLKFAELIDAEMVPYIRPYLQALWVIGWEQGRLEINQHTNKQIGQYDQRGQLIQVFKSRIEAAKKTGFSEKGIYLAMVRQTPTKQGWTWKFI